MIASGFLIGALAMLFIAVALVIWPLLRNSETASKPALAMVLLALIPVSALMLYVWVGTPQALDRPDSPVDDLRAELIELARSLARDPHQADEWFVLGLAYKELRELSSAEHAFRRVLYIDEDHLPALTELAETLLLSNPDRNLPREAEALLQQALQLDPGQQKALWLLGLAARQQNDIELASDYWLRLLNELSPNSSVYALINEQLEAIGVVVSAHSTPLAQRAPRLVVTVSLADELGPLLVGDETVFVIVQAAGTQALPTPLAVQRLRASQLPAQLAFDNADAMIAGLSMANFDQWRVTARVSMAGEVVPQAGDWQGQSAILDASDATQTIAVEINQRLLSD